MIIRERQPVNELINETGNHQGAIKWMEAC